MYIISIISIINIRYISVHKCDSRSFENEPLNNMEIICGKCSKTYSSRQSLYNHRKYCAASLARKISEKAKVRRKLFIDSFKNDYDQSDIPTFDGAEFIGKKPKSDETLLNLMKVLRMNIEHIS